MIENKKIQSVYERRRVRSESPSPLRPAEREVPANASVPVREKIHAPVSGGILRKISIGIFFISSFLLPIFFVPASGLSLSYSKLFLFGIGISLSFFFFLLLKYKEKKVFISKDMVTLGLVLLVISTLLSSFFSTTTGYSIFGRGLEVNSFLTTVSLAISVLLSAVYLRDKRAIRVFFLGFSLIFIIIFLFQFVRAVFGPGVLSFGYFGSVYSSVFGNWYDLPAFFGFSALLALCARQFLWKDRILRLWSVVMLFASLLFLAFFSIETVLILLALSAFLLTVMNFLKERQSRGQETATKRVNILKSTLLLPLVVLVFSLSFLFFGTAVNGKLSGFVGINNTLQAHPSVNATFEVYRGTLREGGGTIAFGTGPGTFFEVWTKYKSELINKTPWWNADFHQGASFLVTKVITLGVLGAVSILILLVGILYEIKRGLLTQGKSTRSTENNFFLVLCLPLVFLWGLLLFSTPGIVMIVLAFVFLGMTIGYVHENISSPGVLSFKCHAQFGRVAFVSITVLLLVSLGGMYASVRGYWGAYLANAGTVLYQNGGDIKQAQDKLLEATDLQAVDMYYRHLVEVGVIQMRAIAAQATAGNAVDTKNLQDIFQKTISYAQKAKKLDPNNYHNYLFSADLYRFFASMGVDGAYEQSKSYYLDVSSHAPNTPEQYLGLAKLEETQNNTENVSTYLKKALEKKPDYAEAHMMMAKVAIAGHDLESAKSALLKAAYEIGNDPSLWFTLGTLEFQVEDYTSAVTAFSNALVLVPNYSNAKYYLGLSQAKLGQTSRAISIFQELLQANPNNARVKQILKNLNSGNDALKGIS